MSGVKRIVLAENKGQEQVTNEDLIEEGRGSAKEEDSKEAKEGEKE